MQQATTYERVLETSKRANWRIEDVIGNGRRMDFTRPFLPESFARVTGLNFLDPGEQLRLNQIRGHGYLAMFELVERCILPLIEGEKVTRPGSDPFRAEAISQFAVEELKHIELFVRFRREFTEDFDTPCGFIGPADAIGDQIRSHGKLGLALFVLAIEWATQCHYVESVRDNQALDPQFKNLLKAHWAEESQHVKIDALLFQEQAARSTPAEIEQAIADFLDIGLFIDGGLRQQVDLDVEALEAAIGRTLEEADRETLRPVQHQAMRWTFLGSAMRNAGLLETLGAVTPAGRARLEEVAGAFC